MSLAITNTNPSVTPNNTVLNGLYEKRIYAQAYVEDDKSRIKVLTKRIDDWEKQPGKERGKLWLGVLVTAVATAALLALSASMIMSGQPAPLFLGMMLIGPVSGILGPFFTGWALINACTSTSRILNSLKKSQQAWEQNLKDDTQRLEQIDTQLRAHTK